MENIFAGGEGVGTLFVEARRVRIVADRVKNLIKKMAQSIRHSP